MGAASLRAIQRRAWTWRQLNDELDRRGSVSVESLQAKSEKLREQLRRTTVD